MSMKRFATAALLTFSVVAAAPVFADADPTVQQIYGAAEAGHLDQAQQMMDKVLRDHPNSGKAHFVAAELYARQHNLGRAREELNNAQRLAPGLPQIKPEAVHRLQEEIGSGTGAAERPAWSGAPVAAAAAARPHFPLGALLLLSVIVVAVVAMFMRRRRQAMVGGYPATGGGYGYGGGPGGGYSGPVAGGGMGSGIAGGLVSGLAAGAGIVAGEELAHHFLDGDRHPATDGGVFDRGGVADNVNSDMGGNDFGVKDSDSWDDGGSVSGDFGGGDSGGGDWS